MAASQKVHMISTIYFICNNQEYYVLYMQNIKFLQSILWPGGAYTDATFGDAAKIMIPYGDEIMNQDYIGPLACMPNEPKRTDP